METCKIRFWVFINDDWTRLTIRPGQELNHATGGGHEEGWSITYNTWEGVGGRVINRCQVEGQDCDGRHSESMETILVRNPGRCPLPFPDANSPTYHEDFDRFQASLPTWDEVTSSQRDYFAEAMGY